MISHLGLRLYRTSGDNSVLYDHDLQRYGQVCLFQYERFDGLHYSDQLMHVLMTALHYLIKKVSKFHCKWSQILARSLNIFQKRYDVMNSWDHMSTLLKPYTILKLLSTVQAKKIRLDFDEDMSVSRAFSIVLERKPDLRCFYRTFLAIKILFLTQRYLCFLKSTVFIGSKAWSMRSYSGISVEWRVGLQPMLTKSLSVIVMR